jgi:hypothetical protein
MINQSDYKSTPVFGKYEALTKQLINETETGIQTSPTTLGSISASPAKSTIKVGGDSSSRTARRSSRQQDGGRGLAWVVGCRNMVASSPASSDKISWCLLPAATIMGSMLAGHQFACLLPSTHGLGGMLAAWGRAGWGLCLGASGP